MFITYCVYLYYLRIYLQYGNSVTNVKHLLTYESILQYVHVRVQYVYVYSTVFSKVLSKVQYCTFVLYFRTKVLSKNVSNYLLVYTFVRKYNVVLSYKVRKYESTFVRIVPYFEDRYEGNSCTRSPTCTGRVQLYTYAYVRVT